MKISDSGLAFIQSCESLAKNSIQNGVFLPYWDKFGKCWTIARGIVYLANGQKVNQNTRLTRAQANAEFRSLLAKFEKCVNDLCTRDKVELKQCEFDSLVDFAYNAGQRALRNSVLWQKIVKHDPSASEQFMRWVYAGGQKVNGLVNRRTKEKHLFDTGEYL